jgi:hypothetical protein
MYIYNQYTTYLQYTYTYMVDEKKMLGDFSVTLIYFELFLYFYFQESEKCIPKTW